MNDQEIARLLTEYALGFLRYDDDHPDVGMGMSIDTALDLAEKQLTAEAARWNSMAALALDFTRARVIAFDKIYNQR